MGCWVCCVSSGGQRKILSLPLTWFCHGVDLFSTWFLAWLHKTCFTNAHKPQSTPEDIVKRGRRHKETKGLVSFGCCFGLVCHQLEQIYVKERLKAWNSRKGSGGVCGGVVWTKLPNGWFKNCSSSGVRQNVLEKVGYRLDRPWEEKEQTDLKPKGAIAGALSPGETSLLRCGSAAHLIHPLMSYQMVESTQNHWKKCLL